MSINNSTTNAMTALFFKLYTVVGIAVSKDQIPKRPLMNAITITKVKYNQICFLADAQIDSIFAPNTATVLYRFLVLLCCIKKFTPKTVFAIIKNITPIDNNNCTNKSI